MSTAIMQLYRQEEFSNILSKKARKSRDGVHSNQSFFCFPYLFTDGENKAKVKVGERSLVPANKRLVRGGRRKNSGDEMAKAALRLFYGD